MTIMSMIDQHVDLAIRVSREPHSKIAFHDYDLIKSRAAIEQVLASMTDQSRSAHDADAKAFLSATARAEAAEQRIAVLERVLGGLDGACDALAASRGRTSLDAARAEARAALKEPRS